MSCSEPTEPEPPRKRFEESIKRLRQAAEWLGWLRWVLLGIAVLTTGAIALRARLEPPASQWRVLMDALSVGVWGGIAVMNVHFGYIGRLREIQLLEQLADLTDHIHRIVKPVEGLTAALDQAAQAGAQGIVVSFTGQIPEALRQFLSPKPQLDS